MLESRPLLVVSDVRRLFRSNRGIFGGTERVVRAVDGVSLEVHRGEKLGIVGESGCGKTTLARIIVGLTRPTSGTIEFEGRPLDWTSSRSRSARRRIQMIFQDSMGSLDPRWRARDLIREPLDVFGIGTLASREAAVDDMLARVGLDRMHGRKLPTELSGGQRQRVGIARAVITHPHLVVCDEPVSALDVSIRAQILDLMAELGRDFGLTYVFISHDLSTVERIADRVVTMYLGRVVESSRVLPFFRKPLHPYGQALLSAIPVVDPESTRRRVILDGEPGDASRIPSGCRFHLRCPLRQQVCVETEPDLLEHLPDRWARCHFAPTATIWNVSDREAV
jgi:oligopeptide/dipeptide ABC transporter ATP-binding protein